MSPRSPQRPGPRPAPRPGTRRTSSFLSLAALATLAAATGLACASTPATHLAPETDPGALTTATAPPWYLAPPTDSTQFLHGVGAASELPASRSAALVDLASKLRVSIRSTQRDRQTLRAGQLDEELERETVAHVATREFQSHEVVETALAGGTYYSLIRVDRPELIAQLDASVREDLRALEARLGPPNARASAKESAKSATPFETYRAFQEEEPRIARVEENAAVLDSLSPGYDPKPAFEACRYYRARHREALANLAVGVVPEPGAERVAGLVQELLAQQGLQSEVVQRRGRRGLGTACRDLCIQISSDWIDRYAVRRHISVLTTSFQVRNAGDVVSSARQHQARGTALGGETEARDDALARLRAAFEGEGILAALGIGGSESSGGPGEDVATGPPRTLPARTGR